MRHLVFTLIASLSLYLPAAAYAAAEIGKPAPELNAVAVDESPVKLSYYKGQIVVLEWTNPDCPFVRKHYDSESMQRLQAYANHSQVIWLTINSGGIGKEGHLDRMQAKDYVENNHLNMTHYIIDADGRIGKLYGAKSTPHMFVIDQQGNIAYMGAIDDKPTPDPASLKEARNYVKDAIDSLIAGKPVAVRSTQAYGCSVKYAN